jgi:hypothetical protein
MLKALDTTPELDAKRANYFQEGLIGVLCWICELGQIDILVNVAMLSCFLASPRQGHLDQASHVYACVLETVQPVEHGL